LVGLAGKTADSVLAAIRELPVHEGKGRVLICSSLIWRGECSPTTVEKGEVRNDLQHRSDPDGSCGVPPAP
jgi:hypothetical protein